MNCSRGFSRKEVLVVLAVLGVLATLLVPALQMSREKARLNTCQRQLKEIALGVLDYTQASKALPPGTICASRPVGPSNQYDVLAEAAHTGSGYQGTSILLRSSHYMEGFHSTVPTYIWWYSNSVSCTAPSPIISGKSNFEFANGPIKGFYCPSRRAGLRPQDRVMMLSPAWTGGGTDYGGCAGRHAAFTLRTGYNLCDATMYYDPNFVPVPLKSKADDTPEKRWGIFGRVNVATKEAEITDGTSNTIMTGELQRITDLSPTSKDGWVIGGPATLFTTGAMIARHGKTLSNVVSPADGRLLNNGFFGSPGSAHYGGANFGMADGSIRFVNDSIDPNIFALLGSMADGAP